MSGYSVYILLAALIALFWGARAGRTVDQLIAAGDHLHHQVLATGKKHPKGGTWAEHSRWMTEN